MEDVTKAVSNSCPILCLFQNGSACSVFFSFFHGKLVFGVAVSTTDRQASRLAAFLQAKDKPMFKGLKSDPTARKS